MNKKYPKTKKISKKADKKQDKSEKYKKEDFIITLPKELFDKDLYQMGCNSTNGLVSR